MKFRYNGNKNKMSAFGYDFSGHQVVDVPATDKHAMSKLKGNSHFDEVRSKAKEGADGKDAERDSN